MYLIENSRLIHGAEREVPMRQYAHVTVENWADTPEEEELCNGGGDGGLMKQWKFRLLGWKWGTG